MRMASTDEFMSAQEKEVDKTVKLIRRWIERLKKKK